MDGRFLAVKVPDDITEVLIIDDQVIFEVPKGDDTRYSRFLPPGQYSFLCTSNSVTEEQAASVVGSAKTFGCRDYMAPSGAYQWLAKAIDSFNSLLRSMGIEGNVAVLRNDNKTITH